MNFFKHHIGDYRRDTSHLTLIEHGAYRQLLDTYYLHEQPIPLETELVFRRLSARTDEEKQAIVTVLNEFFEQTETGWSHGRCDDEIAEYHSRADLARANGKRGGRPKKTESVISENRDGADEETKPKANHKPQTNNHKPTSMGVDVDRFAEFWVAYPRKVAKPEALKAWIKIKPNDEVCSAIMAGLEAAKRSRDWTKEGGQFIPHPATWLNQHRWEDQLDTATVGGDDPFGGLI
jgi:uncharacterized protein YdaU (DUF1376 family)